MKRSWLLLPLLLSASSIAGQRPTLTIGGSEATIDTIFHATVGPGTTTTGIRINGRSNVFYTTVDLKNPNLELRGVQALDREMGSESVASMGNRKNQIGEAVYMAGVNGDFANLVGSEKRTNGPAYIDGYLYSTCVGDKGWKTHQSHIVVADRREPIITESFKLRLPLLFAGGTTYDMIIDSQRDEDCLVIYTPRWGTSTKTNVWGKECQLRLTAGSIGDANAEFEVASAVVGDITNNAANGNMAIPTDGYVLSGVGNAAWLMSSLKPGDRLKMQRPVFVANGRNVAASMVIGGCPMIVIDGEPIDAAQAAAVNGATAIQTTATARTAVGYDADLTTLTMLVVDSHTYNEHTTGDHAAYGKTSVGFDFPTLAQVMIYLGCHTATAMDGGGSSQLYNNQLGTRNLPYGATSFLRPVSNGFFAVNTRGVGDTTPAAIEVVQKNVKLSAGQTFTPQVYAYNNEGVLIDTDVKGVTLTVDGSLGQTVGTTFTANASAATTHAIVSYGVLRCAIRLILNGGGRFVSSGDDLGLTFVVTPPYRASSAGQVVVEIDDDDDIQPAYYNLQGRPVVSPGAGIYIEVRGSHARKVRL